MTVVADTGPLVAAANQRDEAHELAAAFVVALGRELLIPSPVLAETDHLLRARVGRHSARLFLDAVAAGAHRVACLTPALLRRAAEFDRRYEALDLGFVDGCVMAVAERERVPLLTFDFEDFRAAPSRMGPWELVVDEARYLDSTRS
ncbi:MAG: type II toxin-antitoxin system VapC family toxin [Nitriliruptorales bacterium]